MMCISFFVFKPNFRILPAIFMVAFLASCDSSKQNSNDAEPASTGSEVSIVTELMDFQMPDEIKSGWNTFVYSNKSLEPHFFLLEKYPEGKSLSDAEEFVVPVFQNGMNLINEGKMDEAMAEFGKLPEWFGQIVFTGGSGLVSQNQESRTTLKLDPGYYLIECYVKMPNGMFHTSMGMLEEFTVTDEVSETQPPEVDYQVQISSEGGISLDGEIGAGEHTFSVEFIDQIVHENFVGHDVNLVKMADNADVSVLEKWINWSDPKGLISPAPEGFTFLGGVNDMPAGGIGYFTANIEPGKYCLISEVPNTSQKNMLVEFVVGEGEM